MANCPRCGAQPYRKLDDNGDPVGNPSENVWACGSFQDFAFIERYDCLRRQRDALRIQREQAVVMLRRVEHAARYGRLVDFGPELFDDVTALRVELEKETSRTKVDKREEQTCLTDRLTSNTPCR